MSPSACIFLPHIRVQLLDRNHEDEYRVVLLNVRGTQDSTHPTRWRVAERERDVSHLDFAHCIHTHTMGGHLSQS